MMEFQLMKYNVNIPESLLEYIVDNYDTKELTEICGLFCRGKRWVKKRIDKKAAKAYG